MKRTRLVVLSDNRTNNKLLQTEHGLSVYLESPSGKYLLDTGASDLFIRNAKVLGIDLADVDYCLISHGHNDHIGGLPYFLKLNNKAKVILSEAIPGTEYASMRRYQHSITGNVDFSQDKKRFLFVNESTNIGAVNVYANIEKRNPLPLGNKSLLCSDAYGQFIPDNFTHELAFVIDGVLFTGCAHSGILNILQSIDVTINLSIGGFHLLDSYLAQTYETDKQLNTIAVRLHEDYPRVQFYTGHCTGDHCFEVISQSYNIHIHQFYCGEEILLASK
ncbi:MBL fold hydrolase [Prevotella herbatica]|uniref:MBL fold hydrolase n=1 Tax=Prevotella herbatica TaxID=2801997 RepID=A0ABM7P0W8_9BACT|nr:MBL fold metallo-hydrolase [Prevotella herbatica]BCS86421.1 MBL fold hydrolase [Prevotella herbatica]